MFTNFWYKRLKPNVDIVENSVQNQSLSKIQLQLITSKIAASSFSN